MAGPGQYPFVQPPAKKKSTGLIVGVVIAAVLVVGGGILAIILANSGGDGGSGGGGATGGSGAKEPEAAIMKYFDAIAEARTDDAVAMLMTPPVDRTFINDEVLRYSAEMAPLTNVTISPDSSEVFGDMAYMDISFKLGAVTASGHFSLENVGGSWMIRDKLPTTNLEYTAVRGVGMTLNGVAVDDLNLTQEYPFLPGAYEFQVTHRLFKVVEGQFTVDDWANKGSLGYNLVVLADDAGTTLTTAAEAALDVCLTAKEMAPSGCGYTKTKLEDDAEPDLSTLQRKVTRGDLKNLEWDAGYDNPLQVKSYVSLTIESSVKDTAGAPYKSSEYLYHILVDATDPDDLVVTFE